MKLKIAEFSEGGGSQPPDASERALREWVFSTMNNNRIAAAASKIGPPSARENWSAIAREATEDCVEELGGGELGGRFRDQLFAEALHLLQCCALTASK